ncbi:MAG: quinolinate synthase NadA [Candidatus Omnitrophica bacterium]|nr:quinolinate synthase NadA [Candidatus Omnitrophota bacterium]MBU1894489.1 quinolinate synthase NadA [Candidatus Omnitrophota bacterium]
MHKPEFDIKYKEHLKRKILDLKKKNNVLIVAHNYQRDEIQEISDITGDSYALACKVKEASQKIIVFCGVKFMAESAYMLSPDKTILLPVEEAGCPLADMVTVEKLREKKREYPSAAVVCYVNSTAHVKAESDICCTSSNAINVVKSLKQKQIIFVPDKNLGRYVSEHVRDKEIILWDGYCTVHMRLTADEVLKTKKLHPDAEFIAHPECREEVIALADYVGSTAGMIKYVKNSESKEFIIGTELGIIYKLQRDNPGKNFYVPTEQFICANMKLTTLGWLVRSLEKKVYKIEVPNDVTEKARKALEKMLAVS